MIHYTTHFNCENDMVLKGKLIVNDGRSVKRCWVDSVPWLLENVKTKTLLLLHFNTVEPQFTHLIHSWRPFVTRNVRKLKLCVLSESYTATDALLLILPACRQLLLLACVFVTRDTITRDFFFWKICPWTDLFVMRSVHKLRFHCIVMHYYCSIHTISESGKC
jgi:hypothetical protein